MPRLTIAGHPLHAVISDWPVALLSATPVFDALFLATGNRSFAKTAQHTQVGGFFTSLAVAAAGVADYMTISNRNRDLKKNANMHALINIGVVGLTAATIVVRKRSESSSGKIPFLLSAISGLGLLASAWYGGEMVYQLGMRVKGVSPVEDSAEFKIPAVERVRDVLSNFAESVAPPIASQHFEQVELRP